MPTQCQLAHVIVEVDGVVTNIVVPAYSESVDDLKVTITSLFGDYLLLSSIARTQVSVADFAIKLLAHAATQPHEIPDPDRRRHPFIPNPVGPAVCLECGQAAYEDLHKIPD